MVYAIIVTVATALAVVGTLLLASWAIARAREGIGVGNWRWYPSPLALLLLLPLAGVLLWRVFPELLFIPIILPFFWWRGRVFTPLLVWRRDGGRRGGERP